MELTKPVGLVCGCGGGGGTSSTIDVASKKDRERTLRKFRLPEGGPTNQIGREMINQKKHLHPLEFEL